MTPLDRLGDLLGTFWVVAFLLGFPAGLGMMSGYATAVFLRQPVRRLWLDAVLGIIGAAGGALAFLKFMESVGLIGLSIRTESESLGGAVGAAILLAFLLPAGFRLKKG